MRPEQCERLRAFPYPSSPAAMSDFNSEASIPNMFWKRVGWGAEIHPVSHPRVPTSYLGLRPR